MIRFTHKATGKGQAGRLRDGFIDHDSGSVGCPVVDTRNCSVAPAKGLRHTRRCLFENRINFSVFFLHFYVFTVFYTRPFADYIL